MISRREEGRRGENGGKRREGEKAEETQKGKKPTKEEDEMKRKQAEQVERVKHKLREDGTADIEEFSDLWPVRFMVRENDEVMHIGNR